jgi:hypothetical protein
VAVARPSGRASKTKRGKNTSGLRAPAQRTIDDYSRDELITGLLKGMGKKWWTREDAIRAAAHRLGFRRTGRQIRDAFKSAITGAIRRGLLEYAGDVIRRAK